MYTCPELALTESTTHSQNVTSMIRVWTIKLFNISTCFAASTCVVNFGLRWTSGREALPLSDSLSGLCQHTAPHMCAHLAFSLNSLKWLVHTSYHKNNSEDVTNVSNERGSTPDSSCKYRIICLSASRRGQAGSPQHSHNSPDTLHFPYHHSYMSLETYILSYTEKSLCLSPFFNIYTYIYTQDKNDIFFPYIYLSFLTYC